MNICVYEQVTAGPTVVLSRQCIYSGMCVRMLTVLAARRRMYVLPFVLMNEEYVHSRSVFARCMYVPLRALMNKTNAHCHSCEGRHVSCPHAYVNF